MAYEKQLTAKQVANAVLEKIGTMLKKSEILKAETKHDRCVEHVKENSPEVKNPHAVCVAEGVKPKKWEKTELEKYESENSKKIGYKLSEEGKEEKQPEKSDKAFEVKDEKSKSSDDARLAEQTPPSENTHEQAEGNNPPAGETPKDGIEQNEILKGHLKLAKFIGRMEQKRINNKKDQSRAR